VYILSTKPHVQVIIYTNQLTNQNKPMWTLKQVKTRTAFKASHVTLVPLALHFHFGKCNHANMEKRRWWCLFSFSLLKLGKQFFLLVINYNSLSLFSIGFERCFQFQHRQYDNIGEKRYILYTVSTKKVTPCIHCHNSDKQCQILTEFLTNNAMSNCKQITKFK